uniref:G-protein coupled receptors family 1 profile domain-containing protein n=1 Tax=Branchiostoma floridae TaxID=7739 RepID=C3YF39_BRAFL|eukprot:XP_002605031.1 hypothetical protein BRAFLDRAFT_85173 [Branchiostoma floridae]
MSTEDVYSNFSGLPSCRPEGMPANVTVEAEESGDSGVIPSTFIAVFFTLICLMGVVGNALCFYVLCLKSSPRSTITVYILSLATADTGKAPGFNKLLVSIRQTQVRPLTALCFYVLCLKSSPRSTITVYILSLATADTVYILASPFYASTYFTNLWYFGDVGCRLIAAVDVLTLNAATFTLTVMCLERYLAVVDPIKSLKCRSVSLSRVLSGVIWVLALGLSLPMALSTELQEGYDVFGQGSSDCWQGDCPSPRRCLLKFRSEQETKIYFTTLFIVAFVIPGVVLCAFYLRMLCKYWLPAGRPIGEVTSRATESRKKVAKMVSLILVVFWLCYLPFCTKFCTVLHVFFTVLHVFCAVLQDGVPDPGGVLAVLPAVLDPVRCLMFHSPETIRSAASAPRLSTTSGRFVLQNLSYINACANPFLYTLLSDKYKAILKGILTLGGTPQFPAVHRTMTTHSSIELNSMRRSHVMDRGSHVTTHTPSPMFGTPHVRRTFYTIRERSSSEENDAMNIRA